MPRISLSFHLDIPKPFQKHSFLEVGKKSLGLDEKMFGQEVQTIGKLVIDPSFSLFLDLYNRLGEEVRFGFSISGNAMEGMKKHFPVGITKIKQLAKTGNIEFFSCPFIYGPSFVFDRTEFKRQLDTHAQLVKKTFQRPTESLCTPYLLSNNYLGYFAQRNAYACILVPGDWDIAGKCYRAPWLREGPILFPQLNLGLDQAAGSNFPIHGDDLIEQLSKHFGQEDIVGIHLDLRLLGEKYDAGSGVFAFFEHFIDTIVRRSDFSFVLPKDLSNEEGKENELDAHDFKSNITASSSFVPTFLHEDIFFQMTQLKENVTSTKHKKILALWMQCMHHNQVPLSMGQEAFMAQMLRLANLELALANSK